MLFLSRLTAIFLLIFFVSACQTNTEDDQNAKKENKLLQSISDELRVKDTLNKSAVEEGKLTYELAYDKSLTLFPVPYIEQEIKTKFGNAHVIVSGPVDGEPLVLLHGMNASSTMWYPNIKAFSEHYRVYAIDCFLEPGKSEYIGKASGIKEIIDWYFEIFDQLQIKKFNLVGASRGGWLSVNIALRSPSRINKLVLLSPAQTFGILKPGLDILFNVNYSANPKRKKLRDALETMSSNVDNISQIFINQYYLATQKAGLDADILKMQPFFRWELKKMKMPIMVLIGDKDIINGEMSLRRAKKLCLNITTGTISQAGHFLSMDQSDAVNKRVLEFLKQ